MLSYTQPEEVTIEEGLFCLENLLKYKIMSLANMVQHKGSDEKILILSKEILTLKKIYSFLWGEIYSPLLGESKSMSNE